MQKTKKEVVVLVDAEKARGLTREVAEVALSTDVMGRSKRGRTNQI